MPLSRLTIYTTVLLLLFATNPLHLQAFQKATSKSSTLYNTFASLYSSVTTTSHQNYFLFSIQHKRSAPATLNVGVLSQWVPVSTSSFLGKALKSKSRGGKEDVIIQISTVHSIILIGWLFLGSTHRGASFMARHFVASRNNLSQGRIYTLITSSFSHADPLHLVFNIFMFFQVGRVVLPSLMSRFELKMFLLASSLFSGSVSVLVNNFVLKRNVQLLGFSGCCYSLLAVVSIAQPTSKWSLFGMTMSPVEFILGSMFMDFLARRNRVDVLCHVGGVFYGYLWMNACTGGFADGLCQPMHWLEMYPPENWGSIDMRKWSLLWVSVWLGCGATALCMMKPLET